MTDGHDAELRWKVTVRLTSEAQYPSGRCFINSVIYCERFSQFNSLVRSVSESFHTETLLSGFCAPECLRAGCCNRLLNFHRFKKNSSRGGVVHNADPGRWRSVPAKRMQNLRNVQQVNENATVLLSRF